jgi:hypothetical protein
VEIWSSRPVEKKFRHRHAKEDHVRHMEKMALCKPKRYNPAHILISDIQLPKL